MPQASVYNFECGYLDSGIKYLPEQEKMRIFAVQNKGTKERDMRRIRNPWIGVEGYNCFGCCPTNPLGVHLNFYEDGEDIISVWHPTQNHQSWVNTLHGGIQAVLLDELCGWVIFHKLQTAGVTAKMETRYHKPVSTLQPYITLRGRLKEMRRNVAYVVGEIWSADGVLLCECVCTYFTYPQEKAVNEMGFVPSSVEGEEVSLADLVEKIVSE